VRRSTDPDLRNLIELRLSQLSDGETYDPDQHGEMIVVEPGDADVRSSVRSGSHRLTNPFDAPATATRLHPASEYIEALAPASRLCCRARRRRLRGVRPQTPAVDRSLLLDVRRVLGARGHPILIP
jgi:hypothetical protein